MSESTEPTMTRREMLVGTTAALTATALPGVTSVQASSRTYPSAGMRLITIEEHFKSVHIDRQLRQLAGQSGAGPLNVNEAMKRLLPPEDIISDVGPGRLAFMDAAGVDMQVLSYGNGGPQSITDKVAAVDLCREANDELAGYIRQHPARFAGFAVLPLADPQEAAAELDRCVTRLGFKGANIAGTFGGLFLDDPRFLPIFAKAAALNVPIYIHPSVIAPIVADYYYKSVNWSDAVAGVLAAPGFGWHVDSGIHVLRLILSGLFDKFPTLNLISGHWGESILFFLQRFDSMLSPIMPGLRRKISEYYRSHVYVTPSGLFFNPHLQFALAELGANRILYSADYPYLVDQDTRQFLEQAPISTDDRAKIAHGNIEKLLRI